MSMVDFRPRRLGHVNLYVSDLERSILFYEKICGIELVRREPEIRGGFHSNGNTHHDIGMIELSRGVDRRGRDGKVQIAASRGTEVGLNHLGWEMETEVELVAAYDRLKAAGIRPYRLSDHQISHSVYIADPDENVHEFYADAIPDWRRIFNLEHEDLVTREWDPHGEPPRSDRNYPVTPAIRSVAGAPLSPVRITGATIATRNFDRMKDFFTAVAGLTPESRDFRGKRAVVFSGSRRHPDLTLVEAGDGPIGLRLFAFSLAENVDLEAAAARLTGVLPEKPRLVQADDRRSLVLRDPDGFQVEFYRSRSGEAVFPLAA